MLLEFFLSVFKIINSSSLSFILYSMLDYLKENMNHISTGSTNKSDKFIFALDNLLVQWF